MWLLRENAHHLTVSEGSGKQIYKALVQLLSRVGLFATQWTVARQASLSRRQLKLMSIALVMPSNHLILS